MPSKIIITFTESSNKMDTVISVEKSGTPLENESAIILKQDVVSLFRRILKDQEEE